MNLKELKTRINDWYMSKPAAERQKMKKYFLVIPGAAMIFIISMWALFGSYMTNEKSDTGKANMELPEGDSSELNGNKLKAVAEAAIREEKEHQDSVLQAAMALTDTIANDTALSGSAQSPIEQSAQTYNEVQASLDDFFVPETSEADLQVAELQGRIDELEAQNALAQQQVQQPDQMEMLERSYQLAAQYMGNGNTGNSQAPQPQEEKGKRNVQPVAQVNRNVVSSLSATSSRGFNTSVGGKPTTVKNTIAAVVAGNQSVVDGESVKFRTTEPMWIGNRLIPRNTTITGSARIQGERLEIEITSVECEGSVYEVELQVYDSDGQEGINIPQSMESDTLHEIGANMGSTMGSSINISTNTGAQIASDVGRGLINGVSQYLTKKLRTVKVHLKAGYRVMLYQPE